MYRKVVPERNAKFMELGDVPKHIAELIHKLKNHEEMERRRKEMDRSMCKVNCFFLLLFCNQNQLRRVKAKEVSLWVGVLATALTYMLRTPTTV